MGSFRFSAYRRYAVSLLAVLTLVFSVLFGGASPSSALSIWSDTDKPQVLADQDTSAIELGMKFRSSVSTTISGVKFYKGAGNTGTHVGSLWDRAGKRLATVTFTNETASGWQKAYFATPVAIAASTTYVVSYHAPSGRYSVNENYFKTAKTNGTLIALQNGTDGGNGVYKYGASAFPTSSFKASNYWVDAIVGLSEPPVPPSDTTAPTVTLSTPAVGQTVSGEIGLSATASDETGISGVQFKVDGMDVGSQDTAAPYSVMWDSRSVTNGTHTVTAIAKDVAGNQTTSTPISVTVNNEAFTTVSSIWSTTATPDVAANNDPAAVELGLKFRSSVPTTVTGVKFYKGVGNIGTHTGSLWSANGTRLATVVFAGESVSGWQTAYFTTPVQIQANTTYIVSYHAPNGNYATSSQYFETNSYTNGNLTALKHGADGGNGVYRYGASAFPADSFWGANYWVDVVTAANGVQPPVVDTEAPYVTGVTPSAGTTNVAVSAEVSARFSEALDTMTVNQGSVVLKDASNSVIPATISYTSETNKIVVVPVNNLASSATYSVAITSAVKDKSGNPLAADYSWSFTTEAAAIQQVSPLAQGHGGPILVVTKTGQPFTEYYSEILRAEGVNSFKAAEISNLSEEILAQYDIVILGDMTINDAQFTMINTWVSGGGKLVAMSPDKKLAGLLGLTDLSSTLDEGYLQIDTQNGPGLGITGQSIQYHGGADLYKVNTDTRTLATLFSNASTATTSPAVTVRSVGENGGKAVAFTYDLARSVVYTHQGNPAWSGQDRDGNGVIRPNDLFYGAKADDSRGDYIDLGKVAIPQADEQQRFLVNILQDINKDSRPMPKLSYLPYNKKAAVVLAADDHDTDRGPAELDYMIAQSSPGCVVEDWGCIRATTLMYTNTPLTDSQAVSYHNQGFDFGIHTNSGCADWTPISLASSLDSGLASFKTKYPSLPAQRTNRIHCIAWSDYTTMAKLSAERNIRLDLNYYYWPGSWVQDRPGFMTGSGLTMRFADADGTMIDTYQLPSHLVNESGQTFPRNIDTMLDKALGPEGYYGILGTHYDYSDSFNRQLVQSAKARNVPLVSGEQIIDWTDARNASYFSNGSWSGDTYSFKATIDSKMRQMGRVLLPMKSKNGVVLSISLNGVPVDFATETMKGVAYAVFTASTGQYQVVYGNDTVAPQVAGTTPVDSAVNVATDVKPKVVFSEALDPVSISTNTVKLFTNGEMVSATVAYEPDTKSVVITPASRLNSQTVYTIAVFSGITDTSGNSLAQASTSSFTTGDSTMSIWSPTNQVGGYATDNEIIELGVQFRSSQSGSINKILFYKSPNDPASKHNVTLWSSSGQALGAATTSGETAGGWQVASFAAPVAITSGTTYTASYLSPNGHYSYTSGGLSNGYTSGPLSVLPSGGVFVYGGGMPNRSYGGANYWVDVVFEPTK